MAQGEMAFFARPSSSAVRIVAPSPSSEPSSPKSASKKDSTQRQCRNILIYGSCKYQDKGCIYYHPSRDATSPVSPESPVPSAALPAQAVNAPVFVPKSANPGSPSPAPATAAIQSATSTESSLAEYHDGHDPYDPFAYGESNEEYPADNSLYPYDAMSDSQQMLGYDLTPSIDSLYPGQYPFIRQPLNYHLYTQPRPESLAHKYFISDDIREELLRRAEIVQTAPAPGLGLPEDLQGYHSLIPLEHASGDRRKFGSWYSVVYRATNSADGVAYVLRRIENFRLMQQTAFSAIEAWSRIRHPNIASVREAFTTRAFNDNSLVVVYDYHPNAQTVYDAHIKPQLSSYGAQGRGQGSPRMRVPEQTIWSLIAQVASAVKTVHDAGLAVRIIDASKIIVTGKNRFRIGSCGIVDVLMYEAHTEIALLQQEDLAMFGKLIFTLCCGNPAILNNFPKAVEIVGKHYSVDLQKVAVYLVSNPGPHKRIDQVFEMMGSRLLTEMDEAHNAVDRLEGELMSELENGRLVRLLCKFGFINERPEFAREPRWSETGDRYIVKLFRDFVFHQVDEQGNPVVNLTHVLTCLNKLDAGTDERIMLVSRDEQSCLVVSYKEIKSCIDSAFSELARTGKR